MAWLHHRGLFLHIQTVQQGSFPTVPPCHFRHSGTLQQSRPSHTQTHTNIRARTPRHVRIARVTLRVFLPIRASEDSALFPQTRTCMHTHSQSPDTHFPTLLASWEGNARERESEQEHMLDRRLLRGDISLWMLSYKL